MKNPSLHKPSAPVSLDTDTSLAGLQAKHEHELENLTLTRQPLKTFKLFMLAIIQYLHRSVLYLLTHGGWLMISIAILLLFTVLLLTVEGPHERHIEEIVEYLKFGLWWVALGVASSIGLGSGLHTFVLYLGPHIALFTIKAMKCGRVDIKSAPYDTIQLNRSPSWLEKNCSEFGPPLFPSISHAPRIPLTNILPEIQLEAILWGIGTVLGELPPYFVSRAAQLSGPRVDPKKEVVATRVNKIQGWFRSHSQYLNFFTILVLASVPNPLFDLAGIMCGQFGVPFWTFFFATLIGKAIIKTHVQTVFIILVCNNQLLHWIENKLIRVLSLIPGFASVLPNLVSNIHAMRDKYMAISPVPSNVKVKKWNLSFSSVWNAVVLLMIVNFFNKIVTSTAQSYLKKQQEKDMAESKNKSSTSEKALE